MICRGTRIVFRDRDLRPDLRRQLGIFRAFLYHRDGHEEILGVCTRLVFIEYSHHERLVHIGVIGGVIGQVCVDHGTRQRASFRHPVGDGQLLAGKVAFTGDDDSACLVISRHIAVARNRRAQLYAKLGVGKFDSDVVGNLQGGFIGLSRLRRCSPSIRFGRTLACSTLPLHGGRDFVGYENRARIRTLSGDGNHPAGFLESRAFRFGLIIICIKFGTVFRYAIRVQLFAAQGFSIREADHALENAVVVRLGRQGSARQIRIGGKRADSAGYPQHSCKQNDGRDETPRNGHSTIGAHTFP